MRIESLADPWRRTRSKVDGGEGVRESTKSLPTGSGLVNLGDFTEKVLGRALRPRPLSNDGEGWFEARKREGERKKKGGLKEGRRSQL